MIESNMVTIEYKTDQNYPIFQKKIKDKSILVVFDNNTQQYYEKFAIIISNNANKVLQLNLGDRVIADESSINKIESNINGIDQIVGLGSGTISDLCKYISSNHNIELTLIPTAPSMDGYLSKGAALILDRKKVTKEVEMPNHILIDTDILVNAPRRMISSGYGDIFGKFTCLADWEFSNYINDEAIHKESFDLMTKTLKETVEIVKNSDPYSKASIEKLIDALLIAGIAMAKCGNSRPASGSEHHMSHFLEMHYLDDLDAPLHGEKVAIGTLVSIRLYNWLLENSKDEVIEKIVKKLPNINDLENLYLSAGLSTSFSNLGVDKDLFSEMIKNAHLIRPRYTILTYYNDNKHINNALEKLLGIYY